MKTSPVRRRATALLCLELLLVSASASAHPPMWPEPKPQPVPAIFPPIPVPPRNAPNFQAPSALDCARPVTTREVPGRAEGGQSARREELAKAAPDARGAAESRFADAARPRSEAAPAAAARALPAPPPAPAAAPRPVQPEFVPDDGRPMQPQFAPQAVVTAGVVDDNADFASYLAFRDRTRVQHRPVDVRERYLLEVKDARGRPAGDAEVAVQAASGYALWARTDAGGRAWLHPDAFDPARSQQYEVLARKDGRLASARLTRGQKSAVEVVLDTRAARARARLDLVFLVDATGSMGDEIDKLKATLRTITAEVARLPSRPDICLGLVAYRDRGDAFLLRSHDFTNDVSGFLRDALEPLQAGGGGDYPESMNEGLHETVHQLSWRGDGATRLVVLLADAPPHLDYGGPYYDEAMAAALGKGIKVFGVGASGLDKQGEYIQRQIAQYTGGKFVFLTYQDARNPGGGPGRETTHDVQNYSVDTLDRLIVRLVTEELAKADLR
ncbi:VWA domain-containing protein [Ramlibacter sp. XY19]|uniref:VWA domain-containing protein n=1 Tax=Ramlibacter paludis TaxID=2908000 RepID=UPI0023DCAC78|nr:VWA domain-containing protein [Ramlibacter paludis]MCG2595589.1 VWA domain-containing protein [Ramlibacter paludis]